MRAIELYEVTTTVEVPSYGSWKIRITQGLDKASGQYETIGFIPNTKARVRASGNTPEEAIDATKKLINQQLGRVDDVKPDIKLSDNIDTAAVLNVPFTSVILNGQEPTAGRFIQVNGVTMFDVATQESYREDGMPELFKSENFVKMGYRGLKNTEGYSISITPNQVIKFGLEFNARYVLDEKTSDDISYRRFGLVRNSYVQHKNDRYEMGVPGITIATWTKKDKRNAGY